MAVKYQYVSWTQCYDLCLKLYRKVTESGYQPDLIVGVARGGWVPARILADLFISHQTANVKVEFYQGVYETDERPRITQPVSGDPRWKRILLVDDISDTGHSLMATMDHLKNQKISELRTVCLHIKPWTDQLPDYYVSSTDAWVVYPWELKEFIFDRAKQFVREGKSQKEMKRLLAEIGLPTAPALEFLQEWMTQNRMG